MARKPRKKRNLTQRRGLNTSPLNNRAVNATTGRLSGGQGAGAFGSVGSVGAVSPKRRKPGITTGTISGLRSSLRTRKPLPSQSITGTGSKNKPTPTASPQRSAATTKTSLHEPRLENSLVEPSRKLPQTCKERPDSKEARKGSGGSRSFVPWCKKT